MVPVVILDVKMLGMDGNATLVEIKRQFPMTEVIMLTAHATVESAIDGLKSGASDYLMKPTGCQGSYRQSRGSIFAAPRGWRKKYRWPGCGT
jgi:DNA-binding NtrC family response regulator